MLHEPGEFEQFRATVGGGVIERAGLTGDSAREVLLLRVCTDLELVTEDAARGELTAACTASGPARFVLLYFGPDVFVDVRGISVLLAGADAAAGAGRRLLLVDPPRCLRRLVDVLDLGGRLPLLADGWQGALVAAARTMPPRRDRTCVVDLRQARRHPVDLDGARAVRTRGADGDTHAG